MNGSRISLRVGALLAGLGLVSCDQQHGFSVQELQRQVQQLNAQSMQLASELEEIRPMAAVESSRCAALTALIDQTRTEADQMRLEAQRISDDMTLVQKTGLTAAEIVPGAHLDSLQIGSQFFRDVKIVSIGPEGVLIHHSSGIARLKPRDVLGHDIGGPPTIEPPRQVVSRVSVLESEPPASPPPPPRPPVATRTPVRAPASPWRVRPQSVEILAWWGRGSPYNQLLRDPFGNPAVAIKPANKPSDRQLGPCAARRPGTSIPSCAGSSGGQPRGLSGYKPIGWNYFGSDLDYLYGRRR